MVPSGGSVGLRIDNKCSFAEGVHTHFHGGCLYHTHPYAVRPRSGPYHLLDGHNRGSYCGSFSKIRMAPDRKNPPASLVLQSGMLCTFYLDHVWPLYDRWTSELELCASSNPGPAQHSDGLVPREHGHGVARCFLLDEPQFL